MSLKREDFFFPVDGRVVVGTTKLRKRWRSKFCDGWGWVDMKKRSLKKDKVNVRKVLHSFCLISIFFDTLESL